MKVHELITLLQNYPMDTPVVCLHEESDWGYSEERGSFEITDCIEGEVERVETITLCHIQGEEIKAVRIS